jgi:hypothetical protein
MVSLVSAESSRACDAYVSGRPPLGRLRERAAGDLHVASRLRLDLKQAASLLFFRLVRGCCVLCVSWRRDLRLGLGRVFVRRPSLIWSLAPLYIGSLEAVGEIRNRVGLLCYRVRHVSNLFLTWS